MRVWGVLLACIVLSWTFWRSEAWLQLCAGLAIFMFGMQCLEEGLRQLAGGRLERWLAQGTGTPLRGLASGIAGTMLLQSSTLVSLLTIAFISSGLIQLAGGLAIIFGANLGATSGIWLLALAGQNLSLSPLALPLLVFGVLAGFTGARGKAAGRVVLGVAFIFLGIEQVKSGFEGFGSFDLAAVRAGGAGSVLLFAGVGLLATVVLQSSHATLMLTLTALAAGQLELEQALAIAIGSNVGSSATTAVMGALGGNRSGQRLALAHVLFNAVTASLALLLFAPLAWLVAAVAGLAGFAGNPLLQLALFHTLFNAAGVALFWPAQERLARWLQRRLPEVAAPGPAPGQVEPARARHLSGQALDSADAAAAAVALELRHLATLSLEAICRALRVSPALLSGPAPTAAQLASTHAAGDAAVFYRQRVKRVYADLLDFMGRLDLPLDEEHRHFWTRSQMAAMQMVEAVKAALRLQASLPPSPDETDAPLQRAYMTLRADLLELMRALRGIEHDTPAESPAGSRRQRLRALDARAEALEAQRRQEVLDMVRREELDGLQAGTLLNDLGDAGRVYRSLRALADVAEEPGSLRELRRLVREGVAAPEPA